MTSSCGRLGGMRENHIFWVVITAISYSHSHTAGAKQQLSRGFFSWPHLAEQSGTAMFSAHPLPSGGFFFLLFG